MGTGLLGTAQQGGFQPMLGETLRIERSGESAWLVSTTSGEEFRHPGAEVQFTASDDFCRLTGVPRNASAVMGEHGQLHLLARKQGVLLKKHVVEVNELDPDTELRVVGLHR